MTFQSSQGCTAVSIGTCTALVRFIGHLWRHNPMKVGVPMGFCKPMTHAHKNPCLWMQVWVLMGMGVGYSGKPQGSLWHSLFLSWSWSWVHLAKTTSWNQMMISTHSKAHSMYLTGWNVLRCLQWCVDLVKLCYVSYLMTNLVLMCCLRGSTPFPIPPALPSVAAK